MLIKHSLKYALAAALLAGASFPARADKIDEYINRQIKQRHIPGLSLAVVQDGRIVKAAGYGLASVELQAPATSETVYEIGSITKQFTAEAVMFLVEEGKLGLDDPIHKYLPDLPPAWARITVRHLLTQTSGLKDWTTGTDFSYRRDYTAGEFIHLLSPFALDFQPGERWAYTNSAFPLLGLIIERASGQSFEQFVAERIFKPLGLDATRFKDPAEIVLHRADGHILENGKLRHGEHARPRVIAPSGGLLSTVLDLVKWNEALFAGRLLKKSSLEQMLVPVRLSSGQTVNHGLAWFMDAFSGHRMVFHHGATVAGYSALVRRYPDDKLTVILLANLDDGAFGIEDISKRVANFYVPGTFVSGLKEKPDPQPQTAQRLLQLLRDLAGGQNSDQLAPALRSRLSQQTKAEVAKHLRDLQSFAFLDSEKLGRDHFLLDASLDRVNRYKMITAGRDVYYTFYLTADGKIARFFSEEE